MIISKNLSDWLAYRYGEKRLEELTEPKFEKKALELNEGGQDFIDNYGNREFYGFIGFLDIKNFSERVKGKNPKDVANYLMPFLDGFVNIALDLDCLIDKTIGDEIMFIIPDRDKEEYVPANLIMGILIGAICDFQVELGAEYPLRLGLSFGNIYLGQIGGSGYREWSVFGESVNLAKRLMGILKDDESLGLKGAFGVLTSDEKANESFDSVLRFIAGFASKMDNKPCLDQPTLKGISKYRCALLMPKQSKFL